MSAIAARVYVRTTNAGGSSTSRYVISKTKVAPIKQLSILKLESEAATLGAEIAGFCESEMTTTISSKHFWTDSTATLGWIHSKQRQKMYIANRLAKIHENSKPDSWRRISGNMNPANLGARGLNSSLTTKAVASTTGLSEHTSRLLEFCRGQCSPHMRYSSDTTSDAGHCG